jgi:hypothetical protein
LAGAQVDTGAIVGNVQDSAGAAIAGASVTAANEGMDIKHSATTDAAGEYAISPLPIGYYTLAFERQGFQTSVQRHIEVTIQSQLKVDVALQVGAVSQSVQVGAAPPLLETQNSSMQQLVGTRTINNLPLNRRNAVLLAQLSPSVTFAQQDSRGLQASGSFSAKGLGRAHRLPKSSPADRPNRLVPSSSSRFMHQRNTRSTQLVHFGYSYLDSALNKTVKKGQVKFPKTT